MFKMEFLKTNTISRNMYIDNSSFQGYYIPKELDGFATFADGITKDTSYQSSTHYRYV